MLQAVGGGSTATPATPMDGLDNAISQLRDVVEVLHGTATRTHDKMYGSYGFPPTSGEDQPQAEGRIAELERKIHSARELLQTSLMVVESLENKA